MQFTQQKRKAVADCLQHMVESMQKVQALMGEDIPQEEVQEPQQVAPTPTRRQQLDVRYEHPTFVFHPKDSLGYCTAYYETSAKLNNKRIYVDKTDSFFVCFHDGKWVICTNKSIDAWTDGKPFDTNGIVLATTRSHKIANTPWGASWGSFYSAKCMTSRMVLNAGYYNGVYHYDKMVQTINGIWVTQMKHHTKYLWLTKYVDVNQWCLTAVADRTNANYTIKSTVLSGQPEQWTKWTGTEWIRYAIFVVPNCYNFKKKDTMFVAKPVLHVNGFPYYQSEDGKETLFFDPCLKSWTIRGKWIAKQRQFWLTNELTWEVTA